QDRLGWDDGRLRQHHASPDDRVLRRSKVDGAWIDGRFGDGDLSMTDNAMKPGVLVTGAAGGIGQAVAGLFASRGHPVTLTDRDEAGLERIGRRLRDRGCKVDMIARDLLDPEAPGALVARTVESWGGI